jgi:hypothetical protein
MKKRSLAVAVVDVLYCEYSPILNQMPLSPRWPTQTVPAPSINPIMGSLSRVGNLPCTTMAILKAAYSNWRLRGSRKRIWWTAPEEKSTLRVEG